MKETKEAYPFKADVPGIKSTDVDVSVSGNRLTISGKRESEKEDKSETYYACERTYGSFMRAFTLPDGANVEAVTADLKDGVLTISVGKDRRVPCAPPQVLRAEGDGTARAAPSRADCGTARQVLKHGSPWGSP